MDAILQKILESTYTLSQLKHRVRALHEYLSAKLFAPQNPPQLEPGDSAWVNSLGNDFLGQLNKDNINKIFTGLDAYIRQLKPLIIYIAFESTDESNNQVGKMLRKEFTGHKIFDVKIDPKLIAGCALSLNGVYKDYSLRVKIENEKGKILESFKKFLT